MAMKTDLDDMKTQFIADTKLLVAEAVDPIKSEVYDLKNEMNQFKQRLTDIETTGPPVSSQPAPPPSNEFQKLVNSLDPAKKRIAFIGWPDTISADARITHIQTLLAKHTPAIKSIDIDNFYTGPLNQRTLSNAAFAEFSSPDAAKRALSLLNNSDKQVGDITLTIKPARTKLNGQRNHSLRKADELIKGSPHSTGKTTHISWDSRAVKVGEATAFTESKQETGGRFLPPYDQLALP